MLYAADRQAMASPGSGFRRSYQIRLCHHLFWIYICFLSPLSPLPYPVIDTMIDQFPAIEGGGSLILAWQIKNKRVLVVGGGEACPVSSPCNTR